MRFASFLLLNAVVLLRPEEIVPDIQGMRLFLISLVMCTLLNCDRLIELLSPSSLRNRPIAVCLLLFFGLSIVSPCLRGNILVAISDVVPDCVKLTLYYCLLVVSVDTRERFRIFVATLILMVACISLIALANFHEIIIFQNIVPCTERWMDPITGEEVSIGRAVGSGVFNDPNDLCLMLGLGILSCVYCITSGVGGVLGRIFWLINIPLFIVTLLETHSRGGLLGVLAGISGYLFSRYGGTRSIPLAIAGGLSVVAVIGGRQSAIQGGGTAHERLMMWCEGLSTLFSMPLYLPTGLGYAWFLDTFGLVAHNSFVQAFVESGFIGGGAFAGMFFYSALLIMYLKQSSAPQWAVEARHYGFSVIVGYAMGCYSLTRNFVEPTYLALGIASILAEQLVPRIPTWGQVDRQWFGHFLILSFVILMLVKFSTQALSLVGI